MFGYITPLMSELKLKDYEKFRNDYLWNAFEKINLDIPWVYYDVIFCILNGWIILEDTKSFKTKCLKHPLENRECIEANSALDYATDLNMALNTTNF